MLTKLVRRPSEALLVPTETEMKSRFAEYSDEDIEMFLGDLGKERGILEEYIGVLESAGLWNEVVRIEESERREQQEATEEELEVLPFEGVQRGNSLGIDLDTEMEE